MLGTPRCALAAVRVVVLTLTTAGPCFSTSAVKSGNWADALPRKPSNSTPENNENMVFFMTVPYWLITNCLARHSRHSGDDDPRSRFATGCIPTSSVALPRQTRTRIGSRVRSKIVRLSWLTAKMITRENY